MSLPFFLWRTKLDTLYRIFWHERNPKFTLFEIGLAHQTRDSCKNKMLLTFKWIGSRKIVAFLFPFLQLFLLEFSVRFH